MLRVAIMNIQSLAVLLLVMVLSTSVFASDCNSSTDDILQTPEPGPESGPTVEYDQQRKQLRISARQQHLNTVLASITDATGIAFINDAGNGCELVNAEFGFLPLENALEQLLRDHSYIVRKEVNDLTSVWLLPVGYAERLTEIDIKVEEFYNGLSGSLETQNLAEQIRSLEQ